MSFVLNLLPVVDSNPSPHHQLLISKASNPQTIPIEGTSRISTRTRLRTGFLTRCTQVRQWPEKAASQAVEDKEEIEKVTIVDEIREKTEVVRDIIQSIDDGNVSVSAYDTAWVALVKDIHGSGAPQFPSSLDWIINNQLVDGSWGEPFFFSPFDRLSATLACVIALTTWNLCPEKCEQGVNFIQQNMHKLKDENPEYMLSGFEVRFPSLLKMAESLGLEISKDSTLLQHLHTIRAETLKRVPMEILHTVPTPLLFSLEGMPDLDWKKLLKLQQPNGSFLCSPASTAYALDQCENKKCYEYINTVVQRYKGGVPHTHPVDLYERVWVVDRLERLGISRYFKAEIKEFLDHVYGHWTPNGIGWARGSDELDIDDTSMALRILRLHGYEIDANAYHHFERDGQFYCFVGQTSQGITEMLSLYRASQILFPGEEIMKEAKEFSFKTLKEKYDRGQVTDRWLITKNLTGEVQYYMDVPWYASLPRLETRYYLEVYGGDEDLWIGKVLYRMYNVCNKNYLNLAKLDYNHCQSLHQKEWTDMERWYNKNNLGEFGLSNDSLLKAYFLAMSSIFEPERQPERLAWAYTAALTETVSSFFKSISIQLKLDFIHTFENLDPVTSKSSDRSETDHKLLECILNTTKDITRMVCAVHGKEVNHDLKTYWDTWMLSYKNHEDKHSEDTIFTEASLLVSTINLCAGHSLSEDLLSKPDYIHLVNLTNEICHCLHQTQKSKKCTDETAIELTTKSVDLKMQELVQHVVTRNNEINAEVKQTFLHVAKSYYYIAHCEPTSIYSHIGKVLFDPVI
nr:ent-labda-8,13E-dienyl diphosphate synthase [Gymnaconitum gymnandrum]